MSKKIETKKAAKPIRQVKPSDKCRAANIGTKSCGCKVCNPK